jgi:hypothetical protein
MEENNDNLIEALIQSNDENSQEIQSVLEHNLQQNAKNGETLEQQLQVQDLTLEAQKETTKAVKEIAQNLNPQEIGDGMTFVVKGLKGDKGDKGDTPTDEELLKIIKPLIPEPIKGKDGEDGKTPTEKELLDLIRPLIPEVKDGETPSDERLLSLIVPLIPKPIKGDKGESGKDGYSPIKGKDYFTEKEIEKIKDEVDSSVISRVQNVISSKTYSLVDLDDVNLDGLTKTDGKYDLGSSGTSAGVSSFNTLTGDVTISAGSNITLTPVGNDIEISATGGGGGTPGGSDTQLQFNNAGSFGGISGATANGTSVTYTTGNLLGADIKASSSAGLQILSNAGTVTALFGAGGGANSTFYGGSKFDYATASTVPYFDASKNLISSAVTPTELGYLSGVTSAIQTQLNAKANDNAVVKLTGNQSIDGVKTFTSTIVGSINGNAGTVTNGVYTGDAGSVFEVPLTFSTGLTRATNTITANLSTGIAGGQSVIGGTASGETLTLSSTSNATKGKILFGTSAYDEVNNRLGIKTASPGFSLSIGTSTAALATGLSSTGVAISSVDSLTLGLENLSSPSSVRGAFVGLYQNGGVVMTTGVRLGGFLFGGASSASTLRNTALIAGFAETNWVDSSDYGSYLVFETVNTGTTSRTEKMRINSTGVGIGTTSPSAKLHTLATTEQLRLGYNASNYLSATIGSTGNATFALTGTSPTFTFSQNVNVPDEAYGAGWNGSLEVPTKNAIYDKIETLGGGGNVSNTGTPVNNQIAVWTDATTIEGTTGLTYDGANLQLTGDIGSTGTRITKGWFTDLQVTNAIAGSITGNAATVTTNANLTGVVTSTGNATAIADAALSIAKTSGLQTQLNGKQATITFGTGVQTALGVNIGSAGAFITDTSTNTLTNKTLTSPVINTPTGIVKGDVGLGNVDNTSDATKNSATATITNKRNQPRTASSTTASTLTPNLSSANVYFRTTQTATLTIEAPIGTPVIGETIMIYVDSAGAQTINFNATYIPFGAAFPTTTTAGKRLMISSQYNGASWQTLTATEV